LRETLLFSLERVSQTPNKATTVAQTSQESVGDTCT